MQSSGGMSNAFTGVLLAESDPLNDEEWEALKQRLLDEEEGNVLNEEGETSNPVCCAFACVLYLVPGALIGVFAASMFLAWLDYSPVLTTTASIFSSMLWSFTTASISYICFHLCTIVVKAYCERKGGDDDDMIKYAVDDDETEEDAEPTEYYFCVGVFIGFCAMCMSHDIMQGFPVHDILILTGLPASAFATLMLCCANRKRHSALKIPILPKSLSVIDSYYR